ncbi:MAG TPA: protein kinase, partial [Planctomycetota bacterium]|nr:protein kinase [Planctomycetota bacterium]
MAGGAREDYCAAERERRLNEVLADYLDAVDAGSAPSREGLIADHPELAAGLREFFESESQIGGLARPLKEDAPVDLFLEKGRRFGEYEILEEIGRGGMGVVYKARQRPLNRLVALKMVLRGEFASRSEVERFRREAEAVAGFDHPNLVPVYEVGELESFHYFSMRLLDGGSLAAPRLDGKLVSRLFEPRETAPERSWRCSPRLATNCSAT